MEETAARDSRMTCGWAVRSLFFELAAAQEEARAWSYLWFEG